MVAHYSNNRAGADMVSSRVSPQVTCHKPSSRLPYITIRQARSFFTEWCCFISCFCRQLTQCYIIIDFCLKLVGRIIVTLLCLLFGMYIGLHHCLNVCECVLVPVCCFYISMDPRGLIQIKWMNEWMNIWGTFCEICAHSCVVLMLVLMLVVPVNFLLEYINRLRSK